MEKAVILALINKWKKEVTSDTTRDGSDEAKLDNVKKDGVNEGMIRCANDLGQLVKLLGD